MTISAHDISNAAETTRLEQIVRQPPFVTVALSKVLEEATKVIHLETLESRNSDSLDFHEIAVWNIKTIINKAFEAGREVEIQRNKKREARSGRRYRLLHVYGSTDPSIIGVPHKSYDKLLKAARKFYNSDSFNEGQDGLFYIITTSNTAQVGSFTSSELEDED